MPIFLDFKKHLEINYIITTYKSLSLMCLHDVAGLLMEPRGPDGGGGAMCQKYNI